MTNDTIALFSFPAIEGKKVTAAFDGGRLSSDGGVMLLSMAERRLGVAERLARCIPDRRDRSRIAHTIADMIRARTFAICCGDEDADDLDVLRCDPAFKLACGRLPDSGRDLCSQPTLSRLENGPGLKDVIRLTYALVDQWMASYARAPSRGTLDIDDTCDVAHGHQQLSLFNAHYDQRCFLPIHVYDTDKSRPVAVILRPGKTPSGVEVRAHLRRLVRRIRSHWPTTRVLFRGDGHYARPEAMTWCEENDVDYVFGLPGTKPLSKKVDETADAVRTERAVGDKDVVRGYAETRHRAGSWHRERRAVARIEATRLGLDIRSLSPTSIAVRPNGSMKLSSVRAARRKISSSCTKLSLPPIARRAARRSPTRFASFCIPPRTGSCSPSATPFPESATWPRPSSRPCASSCSRSRLACSKWPAASAGPSPPPAPRPNSSPAYPPRSCRADLE